MQGEDQNWTPDHAEAFLQIAGAVCGARMAIWLLLLRKIGGVTLSSRSIIWQASLHCCTGRAIPTTTSSLCLLVRSLLWFWRWSQSILRQKVWHYPQRLSASESVCLQELIWRSEAVISFPPSTFMSAYLCSLSTHSGTRSFNLNHNLRIKKFILLIDASASHCVCPLSSSCTVLLCTSMWGTLLYFSNM